MINRKVTRDMQKRGLKNEMNIMESSIEIKPKQNDNTVFNVMIE